MEPLKDLISYLASPQTVADFQKFCGIERVIPKSERNGCVQNAPEHNNGVLPTRNGYLQDKLHENGYSKHDMNHTNGFVKPINSNGCIKNGYSKNGLVHRTKQEPEDVLNCEVNQNAKENSEEEPTIRIKYKFLHFMMHFGASLGNEIFYLVFFPLVFWNIDAHLLRQVAIIWHTGMYIGQAMKDIIKYPRPASPPVIPLEKRYAQEYGMPSTHACVGSIIPFGFFVLCINRYEFDFTTGLLLALFWTILVGLSRIYLGMHSALDVICGLIVAGIIMPCTIPLVWHLDKLQVTHPIAPVVTVLGSFLFAFVYPPTDTWNSARSDTATIHGIGSGIAFGAWLNYYNGFLIESTQAMPYPILTPSLEWCMYSTLRILIGLLILVMIRLVSKNSSIYFLCALFKLDKTNIEHMRKIQIEVPVKFFTYWTMSVAANFHIPLFFCFLGIQRDAFYTEF